ncbi:DEAD/DEAH box helicase family protein [Dietzia sp. SYD-A1]|uniref:restriction endonuclease n=1 Tax=Dietzia sp. SYD-A1 TaxID=2780141 RepID=UPI0018910CA4|nr:DEAD/DEAH box helicase family protein [Dietzia sp. SYD-A1]
MKFKFDAKQQYQLDAIGSLVQLFDGQPRDAEAVLTTLRCEGQLEGSRNQTSLDLDLSREVGAVGNNLVLDEATILQNLQAVQDKNGLEVLNALAGDSLDFDIEMETGTGKTYVYLRTIFELAKAYNFTKFVILVPSVAIKEGVTTSIKLMHQHFRELYPAQPFDYSVYSGKSAEEVQGFATSTNVQIMVMTIDSIRGDASSRIIHQTRDKLNGLRPIDYLKATRPAVIMDEPQNMESKLSQSSISDLDPIATLRFSATHRKQRNVVYRLDPVDAHDHGLVKQIVVAEVAQQGTDAAPYIKVIEVRRDPWEAKLELAVRAADGSTPRRVIKVRQDQELSNLTNNPAYNGWWITELSIEPQYVELNRHGILQQGEEIGGNSASIYREMIRETIREHLRKQTMLASKNIKVLSLFFVDKVENFLGDGVNNVDANGQFVQWFDELFREERAKSNQWQELFPQDPAVLRRGYFSVLKGKKGAADKFQDTSGATKADDDAYDLIMRDKTRLLDDAEPVRFIFSHSALREGWDNPNVFQICTLREMGAEVERRQTIGRGLRLPVDQTGERVADRSIAQLTVIANESYQAFAKSLQTEYEKSGVEIGRVRAQEFSKIPLYDEHIEPDGPEYFGYERSKALYEALESSGMIKDGKITAAYQPTQLGFDLKQHVPDFYWPYEDVIIEYIGRSSIERYVKPQSKRKARKLNKELFTNPEFEEFWRTISRRTTYRVAVDRERLIEATVKAVKEAPSIQPLRIQVSRAGVKILRGGTEATETGQRSASLQGAYDLPDIVTELQEATSLTRKTIIDILIGSGRLSEFIGNPNDFIQMVKSRLQSVLAEIVTEGIQYEKIGGYVYELRELQKDGQEEKDRFLDQMYKLQNPEKSDFDYVVYDSEPERQFAEILDGRDDVKLFMKLPSKFKIDTPVGLYNPDWAIIKHEAGQDRIYMIRETKSTDEEVKRRPTENAKIKAAIKHFAAIGVGDYAVSVPGAWRV